MKTFSRLFLCSFLVVCFAVAQDEDYTHPELNWQTIETPHFFVHFHNGSERTAREVAAIGEEIYGPITEMYHHQPDQKVSFIIRDHDDYSNGAAYFYDNKVEIWAPALDFELRGTHPWLRDVITHEFTHIVQIQTTMKLGRKFPAVYFQWLGYEAERRPDVLYGYPNVIVSYPLSAFVVPTWFAEGVAQYNHPDINYDYWDSHRDMILRMYMLDGNPLTWNEMSVFGKTSLGNESSYNAGFSIVQYIAETYGVDKLREISQALSALPRATVDGAIAAALGKSGEELYQEWKKTKTERYQKLVGSMSSARVEGTTIESQGFGNFYPAFSPDGKKLAYISNKGKDYFSLSSVYLYDLESKKSDELEIATRSSLSFSPDGRYLYYSKTSRDNPHWSKLSDIYRYDLIAKEEERLTHGLRAWNPKISRDGTKLVFAYGSDGTVNVGVADAEGKNVRKITNYANGEQVYTPNWSPDGKLITFGYSVGHNQSVGIVSEDGLRSEIVVHDGDSRNPSFSPDGRHVYYSSDASGIFNIYRYDIESKSKQQITNVLGGAFLPVINFDGALAFASYTSTGYKIAYVQNPREIEPKPQISANQNIPATDSVKQSFPGGAKTVEGVQRAGKLPVEPSAKPYKNIFTSLSIIPLLRVDNYNPRNTGLDIIRPGFYFSSSDMLDKLSLFGAAVLNRRLERDLFFVFEYKDAVPLLYQIGLEPVVSLELYNISRKTDVSLSVYTDRNYTIPTSVTYNLLEFDVTMRQKIFSEYNQLRVGYALSRYSAAIGEFFIPTVGVSQAFDNLYLIGNTFSAQFFHDGINPSVDKDINPIGRTFSLKYSYETNKFNADGEFDIQNGVLVPRYSKPSFHRIELQWNEHIGLPIPKHTFTLSARGHSILGKQVDRFFDFYAGGFIGMRGYPFYALGGNDAAMLNATYRFPIWTSINFRLFQFYFTKLYGSVFGDYGEAWTGTAPSLNTWKRDAGFELRLEAFSFYQYPTRIFFSGAYGFDRFGKTFNNVDVAYGKEWRFYLGVLFGFELNQISNVFRNAVHTGE